MENAVIQTLLERNGLQFDCRFEKCTENCWVSVEQICKMLTVAVAYFFRQSQDCVDNPNLGEGGKRIQGHLFIQRALYYAPDLDVKNMILKNKGKFL